LKSDFFAKKSLFKNWHLSIPFWRRNLSTNLICESTTTFFLFFEIKWILLRQKKTDKMKKGIVILLLLSLLYQLVGYMALFSMVKKGHHTHVHQVLKEQNLASDLVILKFSVLNFDFNKDELEYQGHFYDIVKTEIKGETVYVSCYDDKAEAQLATRYKEIIFNNLTQDIDYQHKTQFLFKFFIKEFWFETHRTDCTCVVSISKKVKIVGLHQLFASLKMPCLTPPPKFYFV
ncbi:MAG: hypothetical protein RL329_3935, partial [Bacteroidota bacterium]